MLAQQPQSSSYAGSLAEGARFIEQLCARYPRVAVTGRPGIGNSAVVDKMSDGWWRSTTLRTTVYARLPWADQPQAVIDWTRSRSAWLMEGVMVARALCHGLRADAVVVLTGLPMKAQHTLQSITLGDRVHEWIEEARRTVPITTFHFWRVAEPKQC